MACYDTGDYVCTYDSGDLGAGCGGGGCDYTSLGTWESATDIDITGYGIVTLDCWDSQNHDDRCNFGGATTDSTHYRRVKSASGCSTPFALKDGTGANFVYTSTNVDVFSLNENYARVEQICVKYNGTRAGTTYGINLSVDYCKAILCVVFDCTNNDGSNVARGILADEANNLIFGCIVYGSEDRGIYINVGAGESAGVVACTVIANGTYGIISNSGSGAEYLWSNYAGNNPSGDYSGTFSGTIGYNASGDASAPSGNETHNVDYWDGGGDDAMDADHLLESSVGNGRNPEDDLSGTWNPDSFFTADALRHVTYDTNGAQTRPSSTDAEWDVGASEFVSAGGEDLTKFISETIGLSEEVFRKMAMKRVILAVEGLQEGIFASRDMIRYFSETIDLVETILRKSTMKRIISESIDISENIITNLARALKKYINESIGIIESVGTHISAILKKIINESINLIESINPSISAAIKKIINETIEITETIFKKKTIKKIIAESISIIENIRAIRDIIRFISDTIDLVENTRSVRSIVRILRSTIDIIETLLKRRVLVQIISESISIVESIGKEVGAALLITIQAIRRVFTMDSERRIFHKDTYRRIFTKFTDREDLKPK